MSKVLTASEIAEVVSKISQRSHAPEDKNFKRFLHGVSQAVAGYFNLAAGLPNLVGQDDGSEQLYVAFRATITTPMVDNPFSDYDTDRSFNEWLADI